MPRTPGEGVGALLRSWRLRRHRSQLDLANEAEVSPRHLSFVETGRSRPSRELVAHLARCLEVPLRERNALLLAAGYAPAHPETPLGAEEMASVRAALDKVLAGHEPHPALIVDRRWDLVAANRAAMAVLAAGVSPALLEPPVNVLRVSLHPEGLAPRIANFAEWSGHVLQRLHRQVALTGDPEVGDLLAELRDLPGVAQVGPAAEAGALLFVPLCLRRGDGPDLVLFSTVATFGTAVDVTLAELSIESFHPADEATERALRGADT